MSNDVAFSLDGLRSAGWRIELLPQRRELPDVIGRRYPWIPRGYRDMVERVRTVCSPDDKAWLLTVADFSTEADTAYAWNEWERQSLDAAGTDAAWRCRIETFWDQHLPVLMSVKSGYAYFALQRETMRVVCGEEPEYEDTRPIAASVQMMLQLIGAGDAALARWV